MRKLLVIEAAYMQLTLTSAGAHGLAKPNRKAPAFDCETPHLWRVSFRIFSAPVYGGGDREAIPFERAGSQSEREAGEEKRHRDARFRQARPLAERFEALLRVFDAPENYICRVARLLRRRPHNTDILFAAPDVEGFEEIDEPVQAMLDDAPRARMRDTS